MWRRFLFFLPLAVGVAVLMLTMANRPAPARKPAAEEVRHVRVLTVRPMRVHPRISGFGAVRPARVWNAVAQVGGKVIRVHPRLKKGEIIEEGEEVAAIDETDYRLAIAQAEANLRGLQARLQELAVSEDNTRALLGIERQALEVAERDYQRKLKLQRSGTLPPATVEQVFKGLLAQRKLVRTLENALNLIPVQRRELEEQIAATRAQLETARANLARTRIVMPFTGRVSKVAVEVSQFVPPGMVLASIDDIAEAEIEAQYPLSRMRALISLQGLAEDDIALTPGRIREMIATLGLRVEVRLPDGEGAVWQGRFARMSDTFDVRTRTVGVIGVVKDPYGHVSPGRRPPLTKGMFVRMDVLARAVDDVIVIPRLALKQGGRVMVVDGDDRLRLRAVKVRARLGGLLIIAEGLKAGERVVLSDVVPALDGQLLAPREDEEMARRLAQLAAGGR